MSQHCLFEENHCEPRGGNLRGTDTINLGFCHNHEVFLKSLFNDHTFLQYRYISAMCSIVSSHFMHCLCSSKYPGTTQRKAIYSPFFLKAKIHNNKGIFKSLANSFITVYQWGMFALGTKTT